MDKDLVNIDLIKKIHYFLKNNDCLKFLNPNIFDNIDKNKEISNISFDNYYLEYINSLSKLDFESVVKISREVYQTYGKEKEFDIILEKMINNNIISNGSLNPVDNNFIMKASENRVLLSGTYYDVILLCHEIGHKLEFDNSMNKSNVMDNFFFETPPIIFELAANNYLRDNYDIDIGADELRKKHILSIQRNYGIENNVFLIIMNLLKEKKLNVVNLYKELNKDKNVVDYINSNEFSIKSCLEERLSSYSYDIGYILGNYVNNSNNRIELLSTILKYMNNGIDMPFTIDESVIKEELGGNKYIK